MPRPAADRYSEHFQRLTLLVGGLVLAALTLFHFPPAQFSFYPRCPVLTLLNLQCPGCGTTRALAALLHGQLREALHLNALTVCMLPAIVSHLSWRSVRYVQGRPLAGPAMSRGMLCASFTAIAVFTIVRNL